MAAAVAPVQVGIFTNDLCIGFRIILQELLDTQVYRVFEAAKDIFRQKPQDGFRAIYERGMKSINMWDTQLKERYRAQVIAQYRQLTDLYHHIYLMYVQEMYDQSLDDVTVRVNIPALSTMLYMFLKLACNHHVILSGEYVTNMTFSGRVLFVETIIRRLLYELLVQQNNIKSISTAARRANAKPTNAMSVHSEEEMLSADMMMGTQRQQAPRLSPTKDADRFWMAPNSPSISEQLSGQAILGPAYVPRSSPTRNPSGSLLSDMVIPQQRSGSPERNSPVKSNSLLANLLGTNSGQSAQNSNSAAAQSNSIQNNNSGQNQSNSVQNSAQNSAAQNSAAQNSEQLIATFVSPTPGTDLSVSNIIPPANESDTVLTGTPKLVATEIPRITSLPNHPVISGSVVASEKSAEGPLFELKSQFTPFKPGGTAFPDAVVPKENRKDLEVDSLQLQPSDQDFAEEARKLLQDNTTDTVTPFDSVTNIANGDRRPPLFFDAVRTVP